MNNCKCLVCDKEFYQPPSRIKAGKGKYCSIECYLKVHKANRVRVKCKSCGKAFDITENRYNKNRRQYCSQQCKGKSTAKEIVCKVKSNGCHELISHQGKDYPTICRNNKIQGVHRYVYEQNYGQIPKDLFVYHKCDNPKCCNPEHLFLGTIQDNNKDSYNKNRHVHGETHGASKLTEENVSEIRNSSKTGKELAQELNVSETTISDIRKMKTWKHI